MKILVQTCLAILLTSAFVQAQERTQNIKTFPETAKQINQRSTEIIEEPTVLGTGKTWAVISWTTNEGGKGHSKIYAGTDPKDLKLANETPAKKTQNAHDDRVPSYAEQEYAHLVRLNNLKPGTTYYFKADSSSSNDHGAEAKSHTWMFTTAGRKARSVAKNTRLVAHGNAPLTRARHRQSS
jgi:hypothetical protein